MFDPLNGLNVADDRRNDLRAWRFLRSLVHQFEDVFARRHLSREAALLDGSDQHSVDLHVRAVSVGIQNANDRRQHRRWNIVWQRLVASGGRCRMRRWTRLGSVGELLGNRRCTKEQNDGRQNRRTFVNARPREQGAKRPSGYRPRRGRHWLRRHHRVWHRRRQRRDVAISRQEDGFGGT